MMFTKVSSETKIWTYEKNNKINIETTDIHRSMDLLITL